MAVGGRGLGVSCPAQLEPSPHRCRVVHKFGGGVVVGHLQLETNAAMAELRFLPAEVSFASGTCKPSYGINSDSVLHGRQRLGL